MVSRIPAKTKTKKRIPKKKYVSRAKFLWIFLTAGSLIIFFSVFIFYIFVQTHQIFSANFADDVLRPAIGSNATIAIEAFFFRIEDRVNQIRYSFVKPHADALNSGSSVQNKKIIKTKNNQFILEKIAPLPTLAPIADEGVWKIIKTASSDALMAETFFRPDQNRSYSIAYLVKMNMNRLTLSEVAGIREPGGYLNPGPGKIPQEAQSSNLLIAAFNGGFQSKDGRYGMIVGNKTYLPLQKNLATLVIYKNSELKIINYTGQDLGQDVVAVRQNGPILLQHSVDVSSSNAWNMQSWGITTTNSMYTWRSGIGVTQNGDLVYAAGPSLVPETLAKALKAAGAVDAMQLDINPVWVRFVIFNSFSNGGYKYYSLTDNMINGGYQYLSGYQKDFFYLLEK